MYRTDIPLMRLQSIDPGMKPELGCRVVPIPVPLNIAGPMQWTLIDSYHILHLQGPGNPSISG
jgi:hypothetical protein